MSAPCVTIESSDDTSPVIGDEVSSMPRMQTHIQDGYTSLGPCPGCELWVLEYDYPAMMTFGSYDEFADAVEGILEDHLSECHGLQEIVYNTL